MRALITGATSGIGKSFAKRLHKRGWELVLTGRNETVLLDMQRKLGNNTMIIPADLSDKDEVFKVYKFCKDKDIDLLVNNAGYGMMISMLGSATATFALVLPSFIMMIVIARMFMKYMNTPTVQHIFLGLRPGVVGLLAAATLMLLDKENFSSWAENPWQFSISVALFVATFVGTYWLHINPIRMIGYAAFAGLVLLY